MVESQSSQLQHSPKLPSSQKEFPAGGILVLDKPAGITSAAAVNQVKRMLPRGTKIGHAGTLDPFATGVLLLLVGQATKQCERLMGQPKTYEATIKLGATTATDDPESPEQPTRDARPVLRDEIDAALQKFHGAIEQVPPAYSALKIAGKRAADRVRAGETVQQQARTVQIYAISVQDSVWPLLRVSVDCGRGTYIRAIARDLGAALGVGGYLTQLRRTRIGDFRIESAATLEALKQDGVASHLRREI
jgi:tRNA pseudouridine55 synthase